jgi:hypothetical protein
LTDDEYPNIKTQGASDDAIKAITMSVAKMDNVSKPADPSIGGERPAASKAKAEAAPAVEEEDEAPPPPPKAKAKAKPKAEPVAEEAEEPVVRKEEKKATAVPAAKANLASMVDDWDDE